MFLITLDISASAGGLGATCARRPARTPRPCPRWLAGAPLWHRNAENGAGAGPGRGNGSKTQSHAASWSRDAGVGLTALK